MARHAGAPGTFDATVSDYVTGRARELVRQFDQFDAQPAELRTAFPMDKDTWMGAAAEILRELTRDV
jgi:hypothetical protein